MATVNILWASQTSITLANANGGSMTNGSAVAAGTDLDVRSGGNAALMTDIDVLAIMQVATTTGIVAGTVMADVYHVPKLDGTNLPQLDLTGGTSYIPSTYRIGSLVAAKAPTANTDTYYGFVGGLLKPNLGTVYLVNHCGQTISANWTLKVYCTNLSGV